MHVNTFSIKGNPYTSSSNVSVMVYITTHCQCRPYFICFTFFFLFLFFTTDCLVVEQQMQTLNSNSYKAGIISGNIEADREAIEMQIDCWGRSSRERNWAG